LNFGSFPSVAPHSEERGGRKDRKRPSTKEFYWRKGSLFNIGGDKKGPEKGLGIKEKRQSKMAKKKRGAFNGRGKRESCYKEAAKHHCFTTLAGDARAQRTGEATKGKRR